MKRSSTQLRPQLETWLVIIELFFLFSLFGLTKAHGGSNTNFMPTGMIFPAPTGILFPDFNAAAGVNPAALPVAGKLTAIQAAYSPAPKGEASELFGSVATSTKKAGVGVGYLGSRSSSGNVNGAFAGAGFDIDPVALGIGVRDLDLKKGGIDPGVDIGLIANGGKGFTWGFVLYDLNYSSQLDVGVGFGGGKKYNMEVNLLLPPFSAVGKRYADYAVTAAATVYAGPFGFSFKTTAYTNPSTYSHTLGIQFWLGDHFNLIGQFTTPRTFTLGATFLF